eukprot:CAMPEP_0198307784 /NCGR_PEP_ID=MMETSP1450-20131203/591_1 /TAXON_ID=753684 ORGANISM="Madagascaria erythrocladiodes, Strain CCMP3234" /NCGR_SAMPLE_ID=MMETSP1450 /ASSEMBLY_ACC=CAM_ASM_001115 /LENGTH=148 /DNA_ID=CAMNT_0044010391 /DNA_START=151 /DNA_END=593 /DNA_ORIENTATION=-
MPMLASALVCVLLAVAMRAARAVPANLPPPGTPLPAVPPFSYVVANAAITPTLARYETPIVVRFEQLIGAGSWLCCAASAPRGAEWRESIARQAPPVRVRELGDAARERCALVAMRRLIDETIANTRDVFVAAMATRRNHTFTDAPPR